LEQSLNAVSETVQLIAWFNESVESLTRVEAQKKGPNGNYRKGVYKAQLETSIEAAAEAYAKGVSYAQMVAVVNNYVVEQEPKRRPAISLHTTIKKTSRAVLDKLMQSMFGTEPPRGSLSKIISYGIIATVQHLREAGKDIVSKEELQTVSSATGNQELQKIIALHARVSHYCAVRAGMKKEDLRRENAIIFPTEFIDEAIRAYYGTDKRVIQAKKDLLFQFGLLVPVSRYEKHAVKLRSLKFANLAGPPRYYQPATAVEKEYMKIASRLDKDKYDVLAKWAGGQEVAVSQVDAKLAAEAWFGDKAGKVLGRLERQGMLRPEGTNLIFKPPEG
jgi:hypothetical protein